MASRSRTSKPALTVEAFLADCPAPLRAVAERLRSLVHQAVPGVLEAVYPGWKLIGYRIPKGKKSYYFGFIAPLPDRIRLGFEYGVLMHDPDALLTGSGSQVRYIDLRELEALADAQILALIAEAAVVATSRGK